jgi:hypothetical protein
MSRIEETDMNCQNHPEVPATAYCRACGKPVCDQCRRDAWGTVYCAEHAPAPAPPPPPQEPADAAAPPYASPYNMAGSAPPPAPGVPPSGYVYSDVSPGLALFLGMIPGVGAIYNGQYAKGLVHAVIFGLIISIMSHSGGEGEPMLAFLLVAWIFYMIFEAYHTARKRLMGEPVDEFSSLVKVGTGARGFPTGAIALIVLGVILLLNTLDILDFRYVARYWPVVLILAGVYMLWARLSADNPVQGQEARNGQE